MLFKICVVNLLYVIFIYLVLSFGLILIAVLQAGRASDQQVLANLSKSQSCQEVNNVGFTPPLCYDITLTGSQGTELYDGSIPWTQVDTALSVTCGVKSKLCLKKGWQRGSISSASSDSSMAAVWSTSGKIARLSLRSEAKNLE